MLTDEDKAWLTTLVDTKINKAVDGLRMEMLEAIEASETRLLTEFDKWASGNELKMRSSRDAIHALEIEMDLLKDRLQTLENRLMRTNGPTQT